MEESPLIAMLCNLTLFFLAITTASGQGTQGRLVFSDKVQMLNCDPAATSPCFRLRLDIVDPHGVPMPLELPAGQELADNIRVTVDNQEIVPFYAAGELQAPQAASGRMAVILVDISGSMKTRLTSGETRFDAAKTALLRFLDNFKDGVDQVAIVPFESHHVEATISNLSFATTKEAATREIELLPQPAPRNNTALYSSVVIGLDILQRKVKEQTSRLPADISLIVMTDGKNEVYKGDDPGLLADSAGLEAAVLKVKNSGIPVIGVGFGNSAEIDESALGRITTKYYMAEDAAKLNSVFTMDRKVVVLTKRITSTFSSPWADRASLAGRTLHISARLKLASGTTLSSNDEIWDSPALGVPVFEAKCVPAEMSALINGSKSPQRSDWMAILRPILVFLGLGGLILILWFWLPRLMWPERQIEIAPSGQRWMNAESPKMTTDAPTGFRSDKAGVSPVPRKASDDTVMQPRTEFTKTRLGRED